MKRGGHVDEEKKEEEEEGALTRDCRGKFLDEIAGSPFRCNETAFHSTGKNIAIPRCRG